MPPTQLAPVCGSQDHGPKRLLRNANKQKVSPQRNTSTNMTTIPACVVRALTSCLPQPATILPLCPIGSKLAFQVANSDLLVALKITIKEKVEPIRQNMSSKHPEKKLSNCRNIRKNVFTQFWSKWDKAKVDPLETTSQSKGTKEHKLIIL